MIQRILQTNNSRLWTWTSSLISSLLWSWARPTLRNSCQTLPKMRLVKTMLLPFFIISSAHWTTCIQQALFTVIWNLPTFWLTQTVMLKYVIWDSPDVWPRKLNMKHSSRTSGRKSTRKWWSQRRNKKENQGSHNSKVP